MSAYQQNTILSLTFPTNTASATDRHGFRPLNNFQTEKLLVFLHR